MPFVEDPACLSKSRLKSDLVAHNVALPPAASRKEVYVGLHLKHIDRTAAAEFSSDEEDQEHDVAVEEKDAQDARMSDPCGLTDDDLKAALLKHGFKAGPIVASTRALYEKKLRKLYDGHDQLNGVEKAVLYSDSEEEENGQVEDEESASKQETVEQSAQVQQESSQPELHFYNSGFAYPQCFLPSSRLRACTSTNGEHASKWNSKNALKSSQSQSRCSRIPVGISRASSVDQRSGLGSGVTAASQSVMSDGCSLLPSNTFSITQMVEEMESQNSLSNRTDTERELNGSNVQQHLSQSNRLDMQIVDKCKMENQCQYYTPKASPHNRGMKLLQEPVKDIFEDLLPDTKTTPTGIYATCRRPIKGAAGRPVQYAYPDTPLSPASLERREVEHRLVPPRIRFLIFIIVACILYLIYINVEDNRDV